jgi:hypothetical protein
MTTSMRMQPGITLRASNIPAKLLPSLHVIPGHQMFVSVEETDRAGVTWRLAGAVGDWIERVY